MTTPPTPTKSLLDTRHAPTPPQPTNTRWEVRFTYDGDGGYWVYLDSVYLGEITKGFSAGVWHASAASIGDDIKSRTGFRSSVEAVAWLLNQYHDREG